jgi:hypothetical protein
MIFPSEDPMGLRGWGEGCVLEAACRKRVESWWFTVRT